MSYETNYKFSELMKLVAAADVPPFLAEHLFTNKDRMAKELSETGYYAFFSPTGEKIEIRITDV